MIIGRLIRKKACKGLAAGAVGGLVAAWVMNQFQGGLQAVGRKFDPTSEQKQDQPSGEDATMKMAGRIAENLFDHPLDRDQRTQLGPVVHYAFGALMGGLYGAAAEFSKDARTGFGSGFGVALFLAADEVGVPLMGLAAPPSRTPLQSHALALASHIVYGVTTETVRRGTRELM